MTGFKYNTNWCAITGAPSSGKTSVIEELAHRGYAIQNEVARELIADALRQGKTLAEVRDADHVQDLQRRILKLKLAREKGLDRDALVFTDRGTPDSIAYFRLAKMDTTAAIEASKIFRYRAVFLFDRLPQFSKDGVRTESEQQAKEIERMLIEDYTALGYEVTRVPVIPVAARADFILQKLSEKAA
ncbi:MAG: AAA family ATPase [Alphaproteobacteria bacterium]